MINEDKRSWYALVRRDAKGAVDFKLLRDRPTSVTYGIRFALALGPYRTRIEVERVVDHRRLH